MLPWSHGDQHADWVKLCLTLKASAAIAPYQYCEWMNINVDGWHILSHHQLPTSLRPGESRRRGRCGAVVSWPVLEFQDWPSLVLEFQDWTSPWNSRGWILHTSSGSELLSKRKWLKVEFGINPLPLDSGFHCHRQRCCSLLLAEGTLQSVPQKTLDVGMSLDAGRWKVMRFMFHWHALELRWNDSHHHVTNLLHILFLSYLMVEMHLFLTWESLQANLPVPSCKSWSKRDKNVLRDRFVMTCSVQRDKNCLHWNGTSRV